MKLFELMALIGANEVIHIITQNDTLFCGKVINAYSELDDDFLRNTKVNMIFTGFSGLCIEIAK